MICALMLIKYVSNLLQLETVEFYVYSDFRLNGTLVCDVNNTIVIACNTKKMICVFIISNHCGIKFLSNLIQLEPCNVMFQVITDNGILV